MLQSEDVQSGARVRVISDPARIGILTGQTKFRAGKLRAHVNFPDTSQFLPLLALELVSGKSTEDIYDLIEAGKFGRARDLRKQLTFIMLNGRLANLIYSMDTTNTDFFAYQYKPVLDFLDSPSNGLLIADEVGLGKTIEAGLIWTELRSRFDARKLLVVCPAVLRDKWQMELKHRFGVEGEIVDAATFSQRVRDKDPRKEMALISSLNALRPQRGWEELEKGQLNNAGRVAQFLNEQQFEEPLFDLVIVDEAHYMRNPDTATSKLGRFLRGICEHMVLLSATPVNLKSRDLFTLLNLVDEDSFNEPRLFDEVLEANQPLLAARDSVLSRTANVESLKDHVENALNFPLLHNNSQLRQLLASPPTVEQLQNLEFCTELANKLERMNLLGRAVTRTRKRDVTEWRVLREAIPEYITPNSEEIELYEGVTQLVRDYCDKSGTLEGFLLVMPQRQLSSSMPAALRAWQSRVGDENSIYEDLGQEYHSERGPIVEELVQNAYSLGSYEVLRANDSKYARLQEMLVDFSATYPNEKIILFSYFKPTLRYLQERLQEEGLETVLLIGGAGLDKQQVINEFSSSTTARVLLASEVASEGVDLQFCRLLINYDLPWNPMRVEQRIGRIDRIGQKAEKITIWNLFYQNTIDARIYDRLYDRLKIFEESLGGLEAVIGERVGTLTRELLSTKLTEEEENIRIDQTAQAIENIRSQESTLEDEASNLIAHGHYILNEIRAAKELNRAISGNDLWNFVRDFVQEYYRGCVFQQVDTGKLCFDIQLSPELRHEFDVYIRRMNLVGKTRLAANLGKPVRCEFRNRVVDETNKATEMISQFHPLVRFVSAEIVSKDLDTYPIVAIRLARAKNFVPGTYAFYIQRWSVSGTREIEKLHYSVLNILSNVFLDEIEAEVLVTNASMEGVDWQSVRVDINLADLSNEIELCQERTETAYEKYIADLSLENEDRAAFQESSMQRHLERQLTTLSDVRDRHRINSRDALVKATEGRINALQERFRHKLHDIQKRKKMECSPFDVCAGVIRLD